MKILAIDPATVAASLNYLSEVGGGVAWQPNNAEQVAFVAWYRQHRDEADMLKGLEFVTSTDVTELNSFQADRGFNPSFRGFVTSTAVGMASVINMHPKWAVAGRISSICHENQTYRAFSLPSRAVRIFKVRALDHDYTVACLTMEDDTTLWLTTPQLAFDPNRLQQIALSPLDLITLATHITTSGLEATPYTNVVVPVIRFTTQGAIDWLCSMYAGQPERFEVDQVSQAITVSITPQGTGAHMTTPEDKPYIFDKPLIGWFTQPSVALPSCIFFADTSCWRKQEDVIARP